MKSRMFDIVGDTWNPVYGCLHNCRYCWSRRLAETRLKHTKRYRRGFIPSFDEGEMRRKFKPGTVVFVSDMGDIFSPGVKDEWIERVIDHVSEFPETEFLFLTKNPYRYHDFDFPKNAILGVTIETNRNGLCELVSRAPPPSMRYDAMKELDGRRFVSIEPVMDFDPDILGWWVKNIEPEVVYIGYDNYNNRLPEPPLAKVRELIESLRADGIAVVEKTIRPAWDE